MHELSIAQGIVDIIHQYVPESECSGVKTVKLKLGDLAGVVSNSLEFCFSAITGGTPLADAALEIEHVPFAIECKSCGETSTNDAGTILCPACGGSDTRVLSGTEMNVVEIELHDEPVGAS